MSGAAGLARRGGRLIAAALAAALTACAPAAASPNAVAAAKAFKKTLSKDEAAAALAAFKDPDRRRFSSHPGARGGLSLKAMDEATRGAVRAFLDAACGRRGRVRIEQIIERERILGETAAPKDHGDPMLYYFRLFGEPGGDRWGFRFEGNQLSLSFTYEKDALISVTPLALGANPDALPESHLGAGGPAKLLSPLVARLKAAGGEAKGSATTMRQRRAALDDLLSVAPQPFRRAFVDAILARGALTYGVGGGDVLDFQGGAMHIILDESFENEVYITVKDRENDFGVRPTTHDRP